jgi:hypothetical protein
MLHRTLVLAAAAAVAATTLTANAGPASPSPAAAKAARDATHAAQAVTYDLKTGASNSGTVTLQRIGRTRSRIIVRFNAPGGGATRLGLYRGSDCTSPRGAAAAAAIPLNPVNDSRISETIVEVPLDKLQSGKYLVAVQQATAQRQFAQTCARLSR